MQAAGSKTASELFGSHFCTCVSTAHKGYPDWYPILEGALDGIHSARFEYAIEESITRAGVLLRQAHARACC